MLHLLKEQTKNLISFLPRQSSPYGRFLKLGQILTVRKGTNERSKVELVLRGRVDAVRLSEKGEEALKRFH